jgi:hypothetical protein
MAKFYRTVGFFRAACHVGDRNALPEAAVTGIP